MSSITSLITSTVVGRDAGVEVEKTDLKYTLNAVAFRLSFVTRALSITSGGTPAKSFR